jgi:hypothetical protein
MTTSTNATNNNSTSSSAGAGEVGSFAAIIDGLKGRIADLAVMTDPTVLFGSLTGSSSTRIQSGYLPFLAAQAKACSNEEFAYNNSMRITALAGTNTLTLAQPGRLNALALAVIVGGNYLNATADLNISLSYDLNIPGPNLANPVVQQQVTQSWNGSVNLAATGTQGLLFFFPMPIYDATQFGTNYPALGDGFTADGNNYAAMLKSYTDPYASPYQNDKEVGHIQNFAISQTSANAEIQVRYQFIQPQILDTEYKYFKLVNILDEVRNYIIKSNM